MTNRPPRLANVQDERRVARLTFWPSHVKWIQNDIDLVTHQTSDTCMILNDTDDVIHVIVLIGWSTPHDASITCIISYHIG